MTSAWQLNLRSPHRNSAFQKIFGLPPEEFLICDFSCSLRRKIPLQGRLFLSARIVGFYANLFGHKTKFFVLWEDIEDIHQLPPSLGTVGSPLLVIILSRDRGIDATHGAKTIIALWRMRGLGLGQRAKIAEEQQDRHEKPALLEDVDSYLIVQDANMTKVLIMELPMNV
ncbi:hypothetical protein ACH5RR_008818 [Cinchona calisaya]|uniref:GRAM domain-containing protein n=1 Tax=Cinchona calisaya TaxID=153742 RepID=A0ABD3AEX1_9GENT